MKRIYILLALALLTFGSCKKKDFMDKFVPEVLYFQNDKVENADFTIITLASGVSKWTVKARVSAPSKLKEIKLYKVTSNGEELLKTYTDFLLSPTVYTVNYPVENISAETVIKIVATDTGDKVTARNFTIKVTQ